MAIAKTLRRLSARHFIDAQIREIADRLGPNKTTRPHFIQLVEAVRRNSDLLSPYPGHRIAPNRVAAAVLQGIENLAVFHKNWIRSCNDWTAVGSTCRSVFASLATHLLHQYPVPAFLLDLWLVERTAESLRHLKWYLHMACVGTIRGADTPFRFNRKQARCFAAAPAHLTVSEALNWARYCRTSASQCVHRPRFLTRRRWKAQQAAGQQWFRGDWKPIRIGDFRVHDDDNCIHSYRAWSIRQILCRDELIAEGHGLSHCVGSYVEKCQRGETSIWSLKVHGQRTASRLLTIEVDPGQRRIVTALGFRNSEPTKDARRVMETWATACHLQIASWV